MAGTGRRVHATLSYEFFSFIMFCLFGFFSIEEESQYSVNAQVGKQPTPRLYFT